MKTILLSVFFICISFSAQLFAADGVTTLKSKYNVPHTVDRLKAIITKKGMNVFADIDHGKAANKNGIELLPTELIIFGNPKIGSPIMACKRSMAIDFPQKMLVWKDRAGQVWLSYNDPFYLADRHKLPEHCRGNLKKISAVLNKFAKSAGGMD